MRDHSAFFLPPSATPTQKHEHTNTRAAAPRTSLGCWAFLRQPTEDKKKKKRNSLSFRGCFRIQERRRREKKNNLSSKDEYSNSLNRKTRMSTENLQWETPEDKVKKTQYTALSHTIMEAVVNVNNSQAQALIILLYSSLYWFQEQLNMTTLLVHFTAILVARHLQQCIVRVTDRHIHAFTHLPNNAPA